MGAVVYHIKRCFMYKFDDEKQPIYICPRCGDIIIAYFAQHSSCSCEFGFDRYIKTNYTDEIYNFMDKQQVEKWKDMLRKRYVLTPNNPYFDKDLYHKREDEDFQSALERENFEKKLEAQKQQSTSTPTLICPKCGSKNFTPVRRKWSFLTGFMTNKVDMVCNGCGWVKKG